jgi:hypothetical protein
MTVLTEAANILDTSEFTVLENAYQHWFGENATTDFINRTFSDYLQGQTPPYWARHYALLIINRFETEKNAQCHFLRHFRLLFWGFKQQVKAGNRSLAA